MFMSTYVSLLRIQNCLFVASAITVYTCEWGKVFVSTRTSVETVPSDCILMYMD